MAGETRQRLDKWLWFARLVRSREAAAALVESGGVRVNRLRVVKPGYGVSHGDVLTVAAHGQVRVLEILGLAQRRGASETAVRLYRQQGIAEGDGAIAKNEGASPRETC